MLPNMLGMLIFLILHQIIHANAIYEYSILPISLFSYAQSLVFILNNLSLLFGSFFVWIDLTCITADAASHLIYFLHLLQLFVYSPYSEIRYYYIIYQKSSQQQHGRKHINHLLKIAAVPTTLKDKMMVLVNNIKFLKCTTNKFLPQANQ